MAFVGGFSYSDVISAGKGWHKVLHNNEEISNLNKFMERKDTFTLGICNGCQLVSKFSQFDGVELAETIRVDSVKILECDDKK